MKSFVNRESGITLVALAIILIVMGILTGVIIYDITSKNGIFEVKQEIEDQFNEDMSDTESQITGIQSEWGDIINHKGIDEEVGSR